MFVLARANVSSPLAKQKINDANEACVKELVENSLDAKATRIEVRLCESGAELLEVWDSQLGFVGGENRGAIDFPCFF